MGLYVLLADDTETGYETNSDWEPKLFPWQQESSNVLFFTFIHPDTMEVPPSFQKLAASRGSESEVSPERANIVPPIPLSRVRFLLTR